MIRLYYSILLLFPIKLCVASIEKTDPVHLYYGMDDSERGVPHCETPFQACSVLLKRYWRRAALIRLCRCPRRKQCPSGADTDHYTMLLNSGSHFKFCEDASDWPMCQRHHTSLTVQNHDFTVTPDEFSDLHHNNTSIPPPKVIVYCRCPWPYYWYPVRKHADVTEYQCANLRNCKTGQQCGTTRADVHALYQTCICPPYHICAHNGGVDTVKIMEMLYNGPGRKAYCQKITSDSKESESDEYV